MNAPPDAHGPAAGHGLSALDRAHARRLAGEREDALRLAASILVATPDDPGAATLVARLLLDANRAMVAGEAGARLVAAWIRRGDLPAACVAARVALEAGGFADAAMRDIAEAFGKGSARVADVAPKPPPLPAEIEIAPFFAERSGEALLDEAERALRRFIASKDPVAADSRVPALPLFGALAPAALRKLLDLLELRELGTGEYALRQGDEGQEAFVIVRGLANVVREDAPDARTLLAALGPGALFGEMALVSDAPRAASVVAVEPTQLLVMDRRALEGLAREDPAVAAELGTFCHGRMISNLMRHSAILRAVDPAHRGALVARFHPRHFEVGEALVRQGQESAALYLLASGAVEVSVADAEGDRVVLARLGPGDVVGEVSLVLRRQATADVKATHATLALELSREGFEAAIREHATLLRELYDIAVQREQETRTVVAQGALDASDLVLV